jgi:cob(I)alamin adenosyltransferase
LLADQEVNRTRISFIRAIQSTLFTIGSHLAATPDQDTSKLPEIGMPQVQLLEEAIDDMDDALPSLKSFLLPGGHQSVSFGHVSRCVCRRAERLVIQLNNEDKVAPIIITYLNRLSDYLYVLARKMGQELSVEEIPWKG